MSGVNDIRKGFIDFFVRNGHTAVASSPLVPRNDPTLMFTNAGMVQFKNVFTGLEKRPYSRAVTAQKCVRAGGKHNDLDNVGYTARHHTFFEMLGNFSFGDYFKEHAIELAWELITKDYGLPKDKLLFTVYVDDDDAFKLAKKIAGLPDSKILRIAGADNFWAMGDTGPCGPCAEIFYDHGDKIPGGPPGSPDSEGDRFIEIWNLVFMQYEQLEGGKRIDLPRPSIDTGMGLERIAAVLQGTHDNYAIDLFATLIRAIADLTGVDPDGPQKASHRVIADHLRASAFLIADGVLPSNEGRGYVLRRIMRRAMRHAELLGAKEPLMWRLVPVLTREMGQAYPELVRAEALITETLKLEETRFRKTLERGLAILDEKSGGLEERRHVRRRDRFHALRHLRLSARSHAGRAARARHRRRSRLVRRRHGAPARQGARVLGGLGRGGAGDGVVRAARESRRHRIPRLRDRERRRRRRRAGEGRQGGQGAQSRRDRRHRAQPDAVLRRVGRPGRRPGEMRREGVRISVTDTQKKAGDLFAHVVKVEQGTVKVGDPLLLVVDHARRFAIRQNHSATHLLHEALRQVLGDHVAQKGSLVAPDRLRFDFSHPKPITPAELEKVEDIANDVVLQNAPVTTRLMALDDAIASGARALFGEKYGDEVRVVAMGEGPAMRSAGRWNCAAARMCGRTGDIGLISVLSRFRRRRRRAPDRGADRQHRPQGRQ